jgi:hypothetical protein
MLPILRVFLYCMLSKTVLCSDCMVLLLSLPESTTWSPLGCLCPLLSSRLLWLCRCPPRGRVELLSLCCNVVCGFLRGIDGAKRQSMTSVGEVTAEEGRGRKCFLVRPDGNRAGKLSLMRRVWCHKTVASAIEAALFPERPY